VQEYDKTGRPLRFDAGKLTVWRRWNLVGGAALAVEQALSASGFTPETPFGPHAEKNGMSVWRVHGPLWAPIQSLLQVMLDARTSQYCDTEERLSRVLSQWGQEASGGWGLVSPINRLPDLSEIIEQLTAMAAELREALGECVPIAVPDARDYVARMRQVIKDTPNGANLSPDGLLKEAHVNRQKGRQALRKLQKLGEYHGHKR
jgi:hypothetical protein